MSDTNVVHGVASSLPLDPATISRCIAETHARLKAALPEHQQLIADAFAGVYQLLPQDGSISTTSSTNHILQTELSQPDAAHTKIPGKVQTRLGNVEVGRLRMIAELTSALIAYVDANQCYQFNNQAYAEWFGPNTRILGRHVREVLGESAYSSIKHHIEAALQGQTVSYEVQLNYTHIGLRWIRATYTPDIGGDGKTIGFVALINDITAHKQIEAELRQAEERFRIAAQLASDVIYESDSHTGKLQWFGNKASQLGYSADETPHTLNDWLELIHPEDQARVMAVAEQHIAHGQPYEAEYRVRRKDGSYSICMDRGTVVRDENGIVTKWIGVNTDITERKRNETALQFLARSSVSLGASLDYETILHRVSELAVLYLADFCAMYMVESDHRIRHVATACANVAHEPSLQQVQLYAIDADDDSPITNVIRSSTTTLLPDISDALLEAIVPPGEMLQRLRQSDIRSSILVPLVARGRVVGAIAIISAGSGRRYTAADVTLMEEVARRAGVALDNARLYREAQQARAAAEKAQQRLEFLVEASTILSSSLEYETILRKLARLLVPALADYCLVDVVDADGQVRRVETAHANPAKESTIRLLQEQYPPDLKMTYGVPKILHSGIATLTEVTEDWQLEAAARDAEHLRLLRELGPQSAILLPLIVQDRTLGVITLATTNDSERRYNTDDFLFGKELAHRAALAIENALLYSEVSRAEQQTRRQAARLHAIAQASSAFAAAGLDLPTLLTTIARSIVEAVGDATVLRLLSADGQWLETQAVYHTNPVHLGIIRDMLASEPQRADEGLNGLAIQTGKPMLLPEFPADLLRNSIKKEYLPYLEQVGVHSFMIVPLRIQGQVIGTLAISRDTPGHPYTTDDQIFVQELADRAALAIDHARLYRAAQDAIQARDQFVAIASHELRTPLTGILGYTEMLLRRAKRDTTMSERDQRALGAIATQGQRLQKLVGDMLELSRIEMDMFTIEPTPLNFNKLVEHMAIEFEPTLQQHTLQLILPTSPLMIEGDSRRLEQVIANLLQNAVKYSPAGGSVTVELVREQNNARLTITDQGIGIPQNAQGHLFQRFYRADNVGEHQISGFGIGLYLVREIVERHNGTVTLQSHEGVGSTFTIRLPLSTGLADET